MVHDSPVDGGACICSRRRHRVTGLAGFVTVNQLSQHAGALSSAGVLRQLIQAGLLTREDAVDRGFTSVDSSMSHRSVLVRVAGKPRFFAKQADPVRSGGRDLSVEARFHSRLGAHPALQSIVPRCRLFLDGGSTLVMDAPDAATLELTTLLCKADITLAGLEGGVTQAQAIVRRYGRSVASIHAIRTAPLGTAPWLLAPLEPQWLEAPGALPEPCRQLMLRLATDHGYRTAFSRVRALWKPTGLIHGDLRCANILIDRVGDPPLLWLVDWELACVGDRAWDIAAVIAEMLGVAVLWDLEAEPWNAVGESAAQFLAGYRELWQPADDEWVALLHRVVPFASLKLVQTLLEVGYGDGFGHSQEFRRAETLLMPWIDELLAPSAATMAAILNAPVAAERS